jgi:SDR family mycofactocin-dependent oxidoreductase
MAGSLTGKVAFITGAARGQGRAHALRLARDGADIIAVDVCEEIGAVPYPLATEEDLAETARLVEGAGRRVVSRTADVRDLTALEAAVAAGVAELGRLDFIVANAGIGIPEAGVQAWEMSEERWDTIIDVNLGGVWRTVRAGVPHVLARDGGGAIVITSSTAGVKGMTMYSDYSSSKHGVVGLMRTLARELAPHRVRVNTIHPTGVRTPMVENEASMAALSGNAYSPEELTNMLDVEVLEPEDVSEAVAWLVSDAGRWVTGSTFMIDAGFTAK